MANYRGIGILTLNKLLLAKDPALHQAFLASLTPEETQWLTHAVAITWVPIEIASEISKKAALTLFPNDPQALYKLGQARAYENVKGLYRVFFQIISVDVVMRNAAKLWPQLHDEGRAWVEGSQELKQATYCVAEYPGLPQDFRRMVDGFAAGILELTGVKVIRTRCDEHDPALWKWTVDWE